MIKIICGTFGYRSGNSIIPKTPEDEPFSCDPKIENRLVKIGVAEFVSEIPEPNNTGENKPEAIYDENTKFEDLKEIAKTLGASDDELKKLKSKNDVKLLIDKLADTEKNASEKSEGSEDNNTPGDDDSESEENNVPPISNDDDGVVA